MKEQLIFDISTPGRKAYSLPLLDVPGGAVKELLPEELLRENEPDLPEVGEVDVVRHFTRLSQMNYGVDTGFYPLGSCTMKYNPKINEDMANLPGLALIHPYQDEDLVQGALELSYKLDRYLSEIAGMERVTLQPAAGAQGELTGILIIKAYHEQKRDFKRNKVIVPDSAHGTNPATASLCGFKIIEIKSSPQGLVDIAELKKAVGEDTAALMLTNPNTLGLFEEDIMQIAQIVHEAGGLLYYDGANMNAVMGYARPGDMGFDVIHFNLHKTFAAPHGGGGPGSGPVGVKDFLVPFLPKPTVEYAETGGKYYFDYDKPQSIGKVKAYYGNFGVAVKAFTYILALGKAGLKEASEMAVLNANYLKTLLREYYHIPLDRVCKHEFIITPEKHVKEQGVHTLDIAKRLIDYGFHPPTIYFPLIVEEAMMIEPTETETKETLDAFAQALVKISREAVKDPELIRRAPHSTYLSRFDEVQAARKPVLRWRKMNK
ncbi:MAG: aminomethyl-transferring glycine dehydrogenase subunit GcvPB [Peptococcaceae bacterium]